MVHKEREVGFEPTVLVDENIVILAQAETLLHSLNDKIYANNDLPPYQSGVGKHIRHVLDFYQAFLAAHDMDGTIDYDVRERSNRTETDRMYAVEVIRRIKRALTPIDKVDQTVMSKNDDGGYRSADQKFSKSSFGRELQFLASHSVHHFAMIAMILGQQGHAPPRDFGVAASTLIHWRQMD